MKIEVNVHKKYFLILLGVVLLIGGGLFVYAQTSTPNPGHDVSQIGGVPNCGVDEALTHDSGVWDCVDVSSSGGSTGSIGAHRHAVSYIAGSNPTTSPNIGFAPKFLVVHLGSTTTSRNAFGSISLTSNWQDIPFNHISDSTQVIRTDLFQARLTADGQRYELNRAGSGNPEYEVTIMAFG